MWLLSALAARISFPLYAIFIAAAMTTTAKAAGVNYTVALEAPRAYRDLLRDNLALYRYRNDANLDLAGLRRLYAKTPKEIADLLATEGFYAPRIEADLRAVRGTGAWQITLTVVPQQAARVGAVDIAFTGAIAGDTPALNAFRERLRAQWQLPPGRRFRQADWEAAKRALLRALLIERFPAARIDASEARVDVGAKRVALSLTVNSGPEYAVGQVEITGLQRYPESVVHNLAPFKPGAPYVQEELLALQTRLQDSGYFKSVAVRIDTEAAAARQSKDAPSTRADHTPVRVPVQVEVVENERRRVGFGTGYSTDTGARGRVQYDDMNLRARGWRGKTGLEVDRVRQGITAGLDFPLRASGARDSINSALVHQDLTGETLDSARIAAARTQPRGGYERTLTLQYQYEEQTLAGAPGDIRQALTANVAWLRRRTDDLFYPTRGYAINYQIGGAAAALLSDRTFARGYIKGARYFPLGDDVALMLRGEIGAVETESRLGIPADFLFRTGGDQTVRGYPVASLGVPVGNAVVGGRVLAVVSAEATWWFKRPWGAAVFYDRGDAADTASDLDPVAGYGAGVRWRSPVGPVQLDVAYGEALARYRVHFSMGFVF